ncbi:cell division protein FtsL [Allohahella sp. A8]|uniref:cell division protein FtsL n=1 Tax=Allohahella sp. A8 TaxID=3141461 RepID=UPI0026BED588
MNPLNRKAVTTVLMVAVCLSALLTIYSVQASRQSFSDLHALKQAEGELQRQWAQLLVEQGAWDSLSRIERLARSEFSLSEPKPDQIALVRPASPAELTQRVSDALHGTGLSGSVARSIAAGSTNE